MKCDIPIPLFVMSIRTNSQQ